MKSTPTPRAPRACPPLRLERSGRGARRSGQALLLAVLLMVFAALLGATMITLVSSNLSQTSRQGGLSAARAASTSGITLVNNRLTNSIMGDNWRPWQDNKPPKPGDSDFTRYFTAFERSKGWVNEVDFKAPPDTNDLNDNGITYGTARAAATRDEREVDAEYNAYIDREITGIPGTPGKACYVKFPDPRGPATNANGPQYLIQVAPGVDGAGNRTGTLKITVIGTSEDEPGAFDLQVANKPTAALRGPFSYARFDSNYDYKLKRVIRTKLTTPIIGTTPTNTLVVENAAGFERGRTIIIGDPNTIVVGNPTTVQSAVVLGVNLTTNTITLNKPVTAPVMSGGQPAGPGFVAGTVVAAASPLMDGILDGDYDVEGDGTTGSSTTAAGVPHTWERTVEPVRNADASLLLDGARKLFFNGGVALDGKTTVSLSGDDSLSVGGLIAPIPGASVGKAMLAKPGAAPSANLPASNQSSSGPLQGLVRDNRGSESANIQPLTPPSIDGENSRYRELTQFADISGGSLYGYGPGVYINNTADIERAALGGAPLSITDSHRLYANNALKYGTAPTINTLEDRHIRGWVSPWEFRARGVLIELRGDKIIFTLDDRSDAATGTALFTAPNPAKAWKGTGGAPLTAATQPGASTYRMVLDVNTGRRTVGAPGVAAEVEVVPAGTTPFNGVIFLEGNARVRGYLKKTTGATTVRGRDVTIASLGSIFVEGSLVRDATDAASIAKPDAKAPRIALLAKRDVVLNLTQSLAHVTGAQDRDVTPATLAAAANAGDKKVTVNGVGLVRVGDIIRVANDRVWHQVTKIVNVSATTDELNFTTPLGAGTAGVANNPVRRLSDPSLQTYTNPDTGLVETFYDSAPPTVVPGAATNGEVFARDIALDGVDAPTNYRLTWLHAGERREAVSFERPATATTPGTFHTRNKALAAPPMPPVPADVIRGLQADNEKRFFASGDATTPPQPDVNDVDLLDLDADNMRGTDLTEDLNKLKGLFPAPLAPLVPPPAPQGPTWLVNIKAGLERAPARRLIAIGATVGNSADPTVAPGGKYSIPLALSGGWYLKAGLDADFLSPLSPLTPAPKAVAARAIGASTLPDGDDDLESTREDFYQRNGATTPVQAPLRWSGSTLAVGALVPEKSNIIAFSQDTDIIPSAPVPTTPVVPNYRLGMPRVEADNFAAAAHVFAPVPFYIQATIFAQEGSWFVATPELNAIPDINNSSAGVVPPFVPDRTDLSAASRYRRPNYRVIVKGSIVQNFAPTARTDENGVDKQGDMFRWINAMSHPVNIKADDATPTPNGRGEDWQGIEYQADPLPLYNNLYLPPTPDLLYTS